MKNTFFLFNINIKDINNACYELTGNDKRRKKILNNIFEIINKFTISLHAMRTADLSKSDSVSNIRFKYEILIDDLVPLIEELDCNYEYKNIDVTKDIKIKFRFNDTKVYTILIDKNYRISICSSTTKNSM